MKFLASALAFATIAIAFLFRYEYTHAGFIRIDRWTGARTEHCNLPNGKAIWTEDCTAEYGKHLRNSR